MTQKAKKMAVIECVRQHKEAISLAKLLELLGPEYNARTIRRWLSEMKALGWIESLGNKKNTRYRALQQPISQDSFTNESHAILAHIHRPLYERPYVSYRDEWLDNYKPNTTFYIPHKQREALYEAGKRAHLDDPAGTYAHQIFQRLLIDLSYNSSRLEGNTYSLLDTQKLLLEGKDAEGKLDEEKIMLLNHKEAIRYLVDTAPRLEITEEVICTLHYLLAEGLVESNEAGKLRNHGVRIGGSTYIPLEAKRELHPRFTHILKKAAQIQNSYEQSLFLLAHLSYLQPFVDVNKRTARLSANIPLIKNNVVPLSFNDINKEDYISAILAIYESQDIRPLCDIYIYSYKRTCTLYDATVKAVGFDEIRVRYRSQRRQLLRHIILHLLKGIPLDAFIKHYALEAIPKADQASFLEDIQEDLRDLDAARSAGLGVTPSEVTAWLYVNTPPLKGGGF